MNLVLLITIVFTLLDLGKNQPCQIRHKYNEYRFVQRHIVRERFDRTSATEWETYIRKYELCNRRMQSFLEDQGRVEQICNGNGLSLGRNSNLCISDSNMLVHDLRVNNNCKVKVSTEKKPVIVACNIVGNRCLPVHFERYTNQRPSNNAPLCRPETPRRRG